MLSTLGETYKRFFFKYNAEKSKDDKIRYYECKNPFVFDNQMYPPIVKVEYDLKFYNYKKKSVYKIYFRNTKNWRNCFSSGLVRYKKSWLFEGNISKKYKGIEPKNTGKPYENPKHFLLVQFSEDTLTIVVDIFESFFPFKLDFREQFIKHHETHFDLIETKKRAV